MKERPIQPKISTTAAPPARYVPAKRKPAPRCAWMFGKIMAAVRPASPEKKEELTKAGKEPAATVHS